MKRDDGVKSSCAEADSVEINSTHKPRLVNYLDLLTVVYNLSRTEGWLIERGG